MKILRFFHIVVVLTASLSRIAGAADLKTQPILPQEFAGWTLEGKMQASKDPAVADPVNAAVLKEYGFSDFNSAVYRRDDGRKLTVKAAHFRDASGAYGALT